MKNFSGYTTMLGSEGMESLFDPSERKSEEKSREVRGLSRAVPPSPEGSDGVEALPPIIAYNIALFNFEQGHLEIAQTQLSEILLSNGDFAPAYCLLGEILYKQKDFPKAISALQSSVELDNNNAIAYRLLGEIHFGQKNFFLAAEHLSASLRIDPENIKTAQLIGQAHKLMAVVSGSPQEAEEHVRVAVEAFQSALDKDPGNPKILHELQELRYHHGLLPIKEIFADTHDIWKTLIAAGVHSNLPLIKKLIRSAGKYLFSRYDNSVNGKNAEGWLPLEVCSGSLVLTTLLVEHYGADARITGRDGRTIVSAAASLGKTEVVKYLVSKGASLGISDKHKENVLHTCIRDHLPDANKTRNLIPTIHGIFGILRQQDQARRNSDQTAFQVSLLKNAGKGPPTGTTLLLQLLTQKNRYNQTVIELADSLTKPDLVGCFREELALLINERLDGLVHNLFVPIRSNKFQPIVCHDPAKIIALSPLYTTFLGTHLSALPGSFFCSGSPAYKWLLALESVGASLISLSPKAAKTARITEIHIEAAHAAHSITETVLGHGIEQISVLESLMAARLRNTIRATLPKGLNATILSTLKQEVLFKHDVASIIADYAMPQSTTPSFLSIVPQTHIVLLKECILSMYQTLYACKVRTFFQDGDRLVDSDDDIGHAQKNIMETIEKDFGLKPFRGNGQYIKTKVAEFSRQLNKEIENYAKKIKKGLSPKTKEDDEIRTVLTTLSQMYVDKRLMNISVPSFRLLTEIFEELAGLQVRPKPSNFGWVATLNETRKTHGSLSVSAS